MLSNSGLRTASGIALMIAVFCVTVQSVMLRGEWSNQLYFGTSLVAVFGYLFLSSPKSKEEERDLPWWW